MPKAASEVVLRNLARRWKEAVSRRDITEIMIFSPYITPSTAESVLEYVEPGCCSVYTLFCAENFAHGSSSLITIGKLQRRGIRVFHLKSLHAKVVIAGAKFASVGSQNLTLRGTKNREASVVLHNENDIRLIRNRLKEWAEHGQLISHEMIEDMKTLVRPLAKEFKSLEKAANGVDGKVFDAEIARAQARKRNQLILEAHQRKMQREREAKLLVARTSRRSTLVAAVKRLPRASSVILGQIKGNAFVSKQGQRFTHWAGTEKDVYLARTYRYVCLLPDSGILAWVRLMRGRLSFIQRGLRPEETLEYAGHQYKVNLQAISPTDVFTTGNLRIELSRDNQVRIECYLLFRIDSLELIEYESENMSVSETEVICDGFRDTSSNLHINILKHVLEPFQYKKKLVGGKAESFFDHGIYKITLHQIDVNTRILIGRK